MYKCIECGHLFEEGEESKWTEPYGENFSGCPLCKGNYERTEPCLICGTECFETDITSGLCEHCIANYENDVDMCYEIGKNDTDKIELNCFLSAMFTQEEIEIILLKHLKNEQKRFKVDCNPFISNDKYWFAERLLEEIKKNEIK